MNTLIRNKSEQKKYLAKTLQAEYLDIEYK